MHSIMQISKNKNRKLLRWPTTSSNTEKARPKFLSDNLIPLCHVNEHFASLFK